LITRQQLDDLLANTAEIGAELDEHLSGNAFAFTDEAEQNVFGADVVMAELQRLTERQFKHFLGPWREGNVARGRAAALANYLFHLAANRFEADAERLEGLGRDAFTLMNKAEQDVFGTDVVVVQETCFLLGEDHDSAGPVCKSFEQGRYRLKGDLVLWRAECWTVYRAEGISGGSII
jgi:hypothetical protein